MPLSFLLFFFREKKRNHSGNADADCFDRADKTKLTRGDQLRPRLTQQRDDDYYTSNGDATNRFHLVFRKLQTNFQWYNNVHRKPIIVYTYSRTLLWTMLFFNLTTCRVIGRPVIFFFLAKFKKEIKRNGIKSNSVRDSNSSEKWKFSRLHWPNKFCGGVESLENELFPDICINANLLRIKQKKIGPCRAPSTQMNR